MLKSDGGVSKFKKKVCTPLHSTRWGSRSVVKLGCWLEMREEVGRVSAPLLGSKRMDFGCDGDYNARARALRGGAGF
jgi:hypothetical protein